MTHDAAAPARRRLTRAEQRDRTRSDLLEAAFRVFARHGYHGASVEEVAEEAGFSKGALYSNFESKEELFLTLVEQHMGEYLAEIAAAFSRGASPAERFQNGARHLAQVAEEQREWCLLYLEFWTYAMRHPDVQQRFASAYARWRRDVGGIITAVASELGVDLPAPAGDLAGVMIALHEGFMLQKNIDPAAFGEDYFAFVLSLFFTGIATLGSTAGK